MIEWKHQGSPDCPCKGCEKRHEACHDDCEGYKEFVRNNAQYSAFLKKKKYEMYIGLTKREKRR